MLELLGEDQITLLHSVLNNLILDQPTFHFLRISKNRKATICYTFHMLGT